MKPLSPWSVKSVDDDARDLARNASQSAGLTLGAWIDRAIRKATGLALATPEFVPSTTASTTFLEAPPVDRGENFEVDHPTTPDAQARPTEQGVGAPPAGELDTTEPDPEPAPTLPGLQLDPEERVGATVEPAATPMPRQWPRLPGLARAGAPWIALAAAALVVGAGLLIYRVGFTGADDRDPSASATEGIVASATATQSAPAPGRAERDDTPPPSEPGVIEMLTAAAEQGDVVAQHDLAARYLAGKAVARDPAVAVKWLKRAASQGMAAAQHRLAILYDDGTGVATDANRAAMWHTRAASQGHPGSQHALALAYAAGRGVKPSQHSAVEWLARAARAGNVASQVALAERYENANGVARDAAKAAEWYGRAAAKGHAGATARTKALAAAAAAKPVAPERTARPEGTAPPAAPAPRGDAPLDADAPLDKTGIAEVQRLLGRLAFKPGPPDGVLGRRTVREIKLYQGFAGLPDDGKATAGLLGELREMVRGMSRAAKPARR